MELFKTHLDAILCNKLWATLLEQGLDQMISSSPFQSQPFHASLWIWICATVIIMPYDWNDLTKVLKSLLWDALKIMGSFSFTTVVTNIMANE